MIKVIGVRFRTAGKIYYFDPVDMDIRQGDHVIVETVRGVEYGKVVQGIRLVCEESVVQPLKPVMRIATAQDKEIYAVNKQKEKEAFRICLEKIAKHGLDEIQNAIDRAQARLKANVGFDLVAELLLLTLQEN